MTPKPELAKALAKAIAGCHSVAKDARNEFHKYDYASADAIINEARKALAEAGLVVVPVEASVNGSEREGADRFELVRTFLLLHESGESVPMRVVWPICTERGRPLDKATGAADTLSLSYLLRDLLLMPRVDPADEVNARDDRPRREPAKKGPPADGAELEALVRRLDAKWSGEGKCAPGKVMDRMTAWAREEMGCDLPMTRWPADVVQAGAQQLKTIGREQDAGRKPIGEDERQKLQEALDRKGARFSQLTAKNRWDRTKTMATLTVAELRLALGQLAEMPDAEPAQA